MNTEIINNVSKAIGVIAAILFFGSGVMVFLFKVMFPFWNELFK